ncbi:MAG: TonB-dependent receptor [Lentisphaeraceae bacterium]|nr:TonB-dependent receptor [Lentisphaeraceae bacterium]
MEEKLTTIQKALAINLDSNKYGTIAEIGAGQEVARFFFQAGGAAGTIAKTMSAYDMTVSDSIYGEEANGRYVSKSRVEKMLNREYPLLVDRVQEARPKTTQYFAFANTVTARGYRSRHDCHGWLGIQIQLYPGAEPSQIMLHVRMLDKSNLQQQEALGILGVNLIYGAFSHFASIETFLRSLMDNLTWDRIEIDYACFAGPYFDAIDNRMIALQLVKYGLTSAALIGSDGNIHLPSEALYKKNVLVARGRFRPVTNVNMDMSQCAKEEFFKQKSVNEDNTVFLAEMSIAEHLHDGSVDLDDFMKRAEMLVSIGHNVLISNYLRFFTLRAYLNRLTKKRMGMILSVPNILDIFNEQFYEGMDGGILEAFGKLFASKTRLYVYPRVCIDSNEVITTDNLKVPDHLKHLYVHLLQNRNIVPLTNGDPEVMGIHSKHVLEEIEQGDGEWKNKVPEEIYNTIISKKYFDYDTK